MKKKFKERGSARFLRLGLGKPHIYWGRCSQQWLAASPGINPTVDDVAAVYFAIEQDKRWKPV